MYQIALADDGSHLTIETGDSSLRFHAIWLRDNSPSPDMRDQGNA